MRILGLAVPQSNYSIGNEMMWGMDKVPLHSERHLWFKICSSTSIKHPHWLAIVSKVFTVHESKGRLWWRSILEIAKIYVDCSYHPLICVDRPCLLSRRLDALRQLGSHSLVKDKRKWLFYHQRKGVWYKMKMTFLSNVNGSFSISCGGSIQSRMMSFSHLLLAVVWSSM